MLKRTLFFSNPARLSTALEQLVVETGSIEEGSVEKRGVPIEDIGIIVLEHQQITITHVLLNKLFQNNVAVITCNDKHMPSGFMLPFEGHTLMQERYKLQLSASEPLKKQLWQQTVVAKIRNQAAVLEKNNIDAKKLKIWANEVLSGDGNNHEGIAAAYYFDKIFTEFIVKFRRSREGDAPNNLMNYGYAIIRATIARALTGSGLLCALGIHHRNKYNPYCLADDIMEPFRPFVDEMVLDFIKTEQDISVLTKEIKLKLLTLPTVDTKMGNEVNVLMTAANKVSAGIVKFFTGEIKKMIYPKVIE